ncbi:ATP-binding protein, partial [Candidatus Saccharibacteria bacterium]|nr:ATP-binding protein [Candidatus Saccharibacteria bacterium]
QSEIEVGLRDKKATKATHAELLKSNLDEVEHLRTLTDRLLLLAKQDDLVLEPTSLEAAAIEAVDRSVTLAQSKKISIDNQVGPIQVVGNTDSLADLLAILLDNAVKYSPQKSTITLKAVKKNRVASVMVADNGQGIDPKDLPHIFERFYRADTSRSSQNTSGHGLGLSIAKAIVEAHNGVIMATSKKGKGTTFTITFPLA